MFVSVIILSSHLRFSLDNVSLITERMAVKIPRIALLTLMQGNKGRNIKGVHSDRISHPLLLFIFADFKTGAKSPSGGFIDIRSAYYSLAAASEKTSNPLRLEDGLSWKLGDEIGLFISESDNISFPYLS